MKTLLDTRYGGKIMKASRATGVNHSLFYRYLDGSRFPSRKNLARITEKTEMSEGLRRDLWETAGFVYDPSGNLGQRTVYTVRPLMVTELVEETLRSITPTERKYLEKAIMALCHEFSEP